MGIFDSFRGVFKLESLKKGVFESMSHEIREMLTQYEDQFEDHLIAINENTSEILSIYEGLSDLDNKLDKMSERLEKIERFLQKLGYLGQVSEKHYIIEPLTKKEKEIFLVIYTSNEVEGYISYADISKKIGLTEDLVCIYIGEMIQKGIPIVKKYIGNKAYIKLDELFMEKQAKENILKIEQRTITA